MYNVHLEVMVAGCCHLSQTPGFVGLLPSRCTVLHGDAGVDADFL